MLKEEVISNRLVIIIVVVKKMVTIFSYFNNLMINYHIHISYPVLLYHAYHAYNQLSFISPP